MICDHSSFNNEVFDAFFSSICTSSLGHFRPRPDERSAAQNWRDVGHNPTLSSPPSSPIPEPLDIFYLDYWQYFRVEVRQNDYCYSTLLIILFIFFIFYDGIYMMNKWKDSDMFTTRYIGEGDPIYFAH